ncbi:MAG: hypothetical protein SVU32_06540, partial [Candidatus Nanohaloarchaea archaeon]|nr:hypothetical protein [Candidatus Nanohaloarchaea archaeon]
MDELISRANDDPEDSDTGQDDEAAESRDTDSPEQIIKERINNSTSEEEETEDSDIEVLGGNQNSSEEPQDTATNTAAGTENKKGGRQQREPDQDPGPEERTSTDNSDGLQDGSPGRDRNPSRDHEEEEPSTTASRRERDSMDHHGPGNARDSQDTKIEKMREQASEQDDDINPSKQRFKALKRK